MTRAQRKQQGSVSLLIVLTLMLSLITITLAVDVGRLYYYQKHSQRVADMVALETLSKVQNLLAIEQANDLMPHAMHSAEHNNIGAYDSLQLQLGCVKPISAKDPGRLFFQRQDPACADTPTDSLQVTLTQSVPTTLLGPMMHLAGETVTYTSTAVARRTTGASFSVQSRTLALNSANSALLSLLLDELLGVSLNLDALDYMGLADLNLSIGQLAQQINTGTANSIHSTIDFADTTLPLGELLRLSLLTLETSYNLGELVALNLLAGAVELDAHTLRIGDLINLPLSTDAIARGISDAKINLLDLLTTSVLLVNKDNAIDLSLDSGPLLNTLLASGSASLQAVSLNLKVIEPPQITIGPPGHGSDGSWLTQVRTAQLRLVAGVDINIPLLASVSLGVGLEAGGGQAALEAVRYTGSAAEVDLRVQPTLARLAIGSPASLLAGGEPQPASISVIDSNLVSIEISANSAGTVGGQLDVQNYDPLVTLAITSADDLPLTSQAVHASTGGQLAGLVSSLLQSLEVKAYILGGSECTPSLLNLGCTLNNLVGLITSTIVDPILSILGSILGPLIGSIVTLILEPVLTLLGVSVDEVQVNLISVEWSGVELVR